MCEDLSATFMIHESFVTQLMKTSGREGVFFKIHSSSEAGYQFELLWLPDDVSHEQALQYAESDKVLGLVAKMPNRNQNTPCASVPCKTCKHLLSNMPFPTQRHKVAGAWMVCRPFLGLQV